MDASPMERKRSPRTTLRRIDIGPGLYADGLTSCVVLLRCQKTSKLLDSDLCKYVSFIRIRKSPLFCIGRQKML